MRYCFLFLFIFCNFHVNSGYKPVVLIHGVMDRALGMSLVENRIKEEHPGTIVYNINRFEGWASLENMWTQVQDIGNEIMNLTAQYPEGIHLLGYSQGGLIARTILQAFPHHKVLNFISLSSPQAGQYGTQFLHLIFPNLVLKSAFELFYSKVGQYTSVGNYWNDPYHQALYYNFSQFLPYVNNAVLSAKSRQFRAGLLKLNKMVLIGGPDDNVITPWQSSQFGFFEESENVVLSLTQREIYQKDLIGLKSLDKKSKLELITVPGVNHFMWHLNVSIVDNYILPFLD